MSLVLEYYTVLGLEPGSSIQEVKERYRLLSKAMHPDHNGGASWATEEMQRINAAHDFLRNSQQKAAYDASLRDKARVHKAAPDTTHQSATSEKQSAAQDCPKEKPANEQSSKEGDSHSKKSASSSGHQAGANQQHWHDTQYNPDYDIPLNPAPVKSQPAPLATFGLAVAIVCIILIFLVAIGSGLSGSHASSLPTAPDNSGISPADSASSSTIPAATESDDPEKMVTAERDKEVSEVNSLKQPLLSQYNSMLPSLNASINRGNSVMKANEPFKEQFMAGGNWERSRQVSDLTSDVGTLTSSRDSVKSSIDSLEWYDNDTSLKMETQGIQEEFDSLAAAQKAVEKDIGELNTPIVFSSQQPLPGFPATSTDPAAGPDPFATPDQANSSSKPEYQITTKAGGGPPPDTSMFK